MSTIACEIETNQERQPARWQHVALRGIAVAVGLLLVTTALLKAVSPAGALAAAAAYGMSYWAMAGVVQTELVIGAMLLSGWRPRVAASLAMVLFLCFAGFSLALALSGHTSCGCFGSLKVHPYITFGLDVIVLVLLAFYLRSAKQSTSSLPRIGVAAIAYLVVGSMALGTMTMSRPTTLAGDLGVDLSTGLVILEPEEWVGKPFPLDHHLEPPVDTATGNWVVLLYHHDCPDCQIALPKYERLARRYQPGGEQQRVLLVEVPPYGPIEHPGGPEFVRLTDKAEWFVQAPVEIQIEAGIVRGVSLDRPTAQTASERNTTGPNF